MIGIRTEAQVEKMRTAGKLLYEVLTVLKTLIVPGATTRLLNDTAHKMITGAGAMPSFLGYDGFPASLCTSVNDVVVHGIPNERPLREGDILGVDCGLILEGWHADSAFTAGVGRISPEAQRLIDVTEACFWQAFDVVRKGYRVRDISRAIEDLALKNGYQPIHALCGHGIGRKMHEDPAIPNFVEKIPGIRLQPGMTLAVEPMIAAGTWEVTMEGWHVATADKKLCAHYEHTLLVTYDVPQILTLPESFKRGDSA